MADARATRSVDAMGLGRRKVRLDDPRAWVFNRMADVYDARPAYPRALIEILLSHAGVERRIADLGAGTGHLALPLAAHGCQLVAIEPAHAMLERLEARAAGLALRALHATAEQLPLADASTDLALIADALHFLDAERAGLEIGRTLTANGALAIVSCEFDDTPFMRALVAIMEQAAPRRPRDTANSQRQLLAVARLEPAHSYELRDETLVDAATLERILRSISFIGPAMNAQRFADFRARVHAISAPPRWARRFSVQIARRSPRP